MNKANKLKEAISFNIRADSVDKKLISKTVSGIMSVLDSVGGESDPSVAEFGYAISKVFNEEYGSHLRKGFLDLLAKEIK